MDDLLTARGFTVGALIFDGLLVQRGPSSPHLAQVLRDCEESIKDTFGLVVRLEEKPLAPTSEDMAHLEGEDKIETMRPFERFVHLLTVAAHERGLRRMGDRVLVPHENIRGVFVDSGCARDLINETLREDHVFQQGANMRRLEEWFSSQDHPRFPILRPQDLQDNVISFKDGWLDINTMKWYPVDDAERFELLGAHVDPPTTAHYFNTLFVGIWDVQTPLWERLVKTQLYAREYAPEDEESEVELQSFSVFQAFVGRLFSLEVPTTGSAGPF